MGTKPKHLEWLVDTKERLKTSDGKIVQVWNFATSRTNWCCLPGQNILENTTVKIQKLIFIEKEQAILAPTTSTL